MSRLLSYIYCITYYIPKLKIQMFLRSLIKNSLWISFIVMFFRLSKTHYLLYGGIAIIRDYNTINLVITQIMKDQKKVEDV